MWGIELRQASDFAIKSDGLMSSVLVSEESLEVRNLTTYGLGFAKSNYYARQGQAAQTRIGSPSPLALDVLEHASSTLAVVYRGQPLKRAKLGVIAPNIWMQEHKTDDQGVVKIDTPWRGQYVVHILHVRPIHIHSHSD